MNKLVDKNARHGILSQYNFEWAKELKEGQSVFARNSGGDYDMTFSWFDTHNLIQVLDFDGDQVVYMNKKTGEKSSYHWTRIRSTDVEFQVYIEDLGINFIHSFPIRYEKTETIHHFEIRKIQYGKPNEIFEIPIRASGKFFLEMLDKYKFYPLAVQQEQLKEIKSKLEKIRNAPNSKIKKVSSKGLSALVDKKSQGRNLEDLFKQQTKVVATKKAKQSITGLNGCKCHPFSSWKESEKYHKQKFQVGDHVCNRCTKKAGFVHTIADHSSNYYTVRYGKKPSDIHLEHAANLSLLVSAKSPLNKNFVATKKKVTPVKNIYAGRLEIGSLFRTNYSSRIHKVKTITSHCTCPVDDGKSKKSKPHIHIQANYILDWKRSIFNHYEVIEKKNKTEYICLSREDKLIPLENPVFKIVVNKISSKFDILWLNCHENDSLLQITGIKTLQEAQSIAKKNGLTLFDGNIRVEKRFMPGAGWMLIWLDAVDGNNILQNGIKTSSLAEEFAKLYGFKMQDSTVENVATKKEKSVKPVKATGNKETDKPAIPEQPKPAENKNEETKDDLIKFRCSSSFKAEVKRLCEKRGHNNVSLLMIEAINLLKAI